MIALAACALAVGPAHGSVKVGQVAPDPSAAFNCGSTFTFAQASTGSAGPSYEVPGDGILTSWSINTTSETDQKARLVVVHPLTGSTYAVVGTTAIQDLPASFLVDRLPARIRVHAGDRLALSPDPEGTFMSLSGVHCAFPTSDASDVVRSGSNPVGSTVDLPGPSANERLNLAATVEPDADSDGFGDESQDACPSDGAAHVAPCSAGPTTIGQTFEPTVVCDQGTQVPTGVSWGNSYTVPGAGVLTSWHVQAPSGGRTDPMKFKILREAGALHLYTVIAESPLLNISGGGIQSFPLRVTVQPGDRIGLYSDGNVGYCGSFTASLSDTFDYLFNTDLPLGTTNAFNSGNVLFRHDVAATLEPDRDGDGFGDITQDLCPSDPTRQACPPAELAAVISKLRQSASRWRMGKKLPSISRKRRVPVGTTFTFTLDKAATARLVFSQAKPGRKVRGKCVPATRRNRKGRRCRRTAVAGTLRLAAHAGVNRVRFQGRLSRAKRLKPGRYTLAITATLPSGTASAPKAISFTIVK
jgi:hypothetical protein